MTYGLMATNIKMLVHDILLQLLHHRCKLTAMDLLADNTNNRRPDQHKCNRQNQPWGD